MAADCKMGVENDEIIEQVGSKNDLGVIMDAKLTFRE